MFRIATLAIAALILAGCLQAPQPGAPSLSTGGAQTVLYAHALYGDPVFDRDVASFSRSLARASGGLADQVLLGYTDRNHTTPTPEAATQGLAQVAQTAVDGRDLVVVMFTSHGTPGALAQKTPEQVNGNLIPAAGLRQFLKGAEDDKQVIILQACFSGSLIKELRAPNRIIMTAAAADRPSFGCQPKASNTWFIESFNTALAQGKTWAEVFALTKSIVTAKERAEGMPPSNPQVFVGADMKDVWNGTAMIPGGS